MTEQHFRSGGNVYALASLDEITPRDLLTFPRDASEVMGRRIKWADIERIAAEIEPLTDQEAEEHPDADFLLTVMIWVSRRAAGDKITFGQCLDDPFSWVEIPQVKQPEDRKPGKPKARKGAKKATSKASGPRAVSAPPVPGSTTPPISATESTTES